MTRRNTAEDFWAKTKPDDACIIWTKYTDKQGYGRLRWEGELVLAHRLAFFLRLGRWPDTELRHLCNRPACVLHAVEGTRVENMQDKVKSGTHQNMRKDYCLRRHAYTDANTYFGPDGYRRGCRACIKINDSARTARRRASRLELIPTD